MRRLGVILYHALLKPSKAVTDEIERSRVTTAAAIALLLTLTGSISTIIFMPENWGDGHELWWRDMETWISIITCLILFTGYLLIRTRYYQWGKWQVIAITFAYVFMMNVLATWFDHDGFDQSYAFNYLPLDLVLAMILFSSREVLWTGIANFIGLGLWVTVLGEDLLNVGAPDAFMWAALLSAILMFASWYWSRLEGMRRAQLQALLEESQRLQVAAEDANHLKTEFLAIVSHELRTPLNSIIGYADLMGKGVGVEGPPLSSDAQELTQRIKQSGKRLLYIINDILDISKIEARRMQVVNRPFSPRKLLKTVEAEIQPLAYEKNLDLVFDLDPAIPERIVGDENLLRRIAVNLASNAVKFTKEGRVNISFRKRADKWDILVSDTGIGIPASMLDVIFEPFRQVDGSTRREAGGTGLGLTICRHLAQLMGGFIKVDSEVDRGSTFTVVLPLVEQQPTIRPVMEPAPA